MGKVKQLWQDEIDRAIGEYHDEVSVDFGYAKEAEALQKAMKRLVSKLHACGCTTDHIEQIVDSECP